MIGFEVVESGTRNYIIKRVQLKCIMKELFGFIMINVYQVHKQCILFILHIERYVDKEMVNTEEYFTCIHYLYNDMKIKDSKYWRIFYLHTHKAMKKIYLIVILSKRNFQKNIFPKYSIQHDAKKSTVIYEKLVTSAGNIKFIRSYFFHLM